MKRHLLITALCFVLMIFLIACGEPESQPNNDAAPLDPDGVYLITNLQEDGTPAARGLGNLVSAPDIHGVLLKYQSEGLFSEDSYFKDDYNSTKGTFKNKNSFYLEYLYQDYETWYGMVFNYVLYVPNIIQTEYESGGGKNPNSGNPFWWYMSTYYGRDINVVRGNWEDSLDLLLNHRTGLLKPKARDVNGIWTEDISGLASTTNSSGVDIESNIASHYYYNDGEDHTVWVNRIVFFDSPVQIQKNRDEYYQIIIPEDLRKAYAAGSGLHSYYDALVWYFEKFYHVSADELVTAYDEDRLGELIDECYAQYGYTEPSADDVDCVIKFNTVMASYEGEDLSLGNVYYYIPGSLKLDDGSIIENCERIYFNQRNGNKIDFYFPETYINQMRVEYANRGNDFRFNGNLVWFYYTWNSIDREGAGTTLTQADIAELLKYRASEGIIRQ